jgi:hypothetical protein
MGVHTPEFSFEHELDRVRLAVTERRIDYPAALDNNYEIWSYAARINRHGAPSSSPRLHHPQVRCAR